MRADYAVLTFCCLASVGCTGNADFLDFRAPTASEVPRVDGVWRGTDTVTAVYHGECLGPAMQSRVGTASGLEVTIRQEGLNLSGTNRQLEDGTVCPITGSFTLRMLFDLRTAEGGCDVRTVTGMICPNGEARDLRHYKDWMLPTLEGNVMTASRTVEYHVYRRGASDRLEIMEVVSKVRLLRQ